METTELTVELPASEVAFIEQYAAQQGLTVSQLIDRYIKRLQKLEQHPIHPEVERISGLIPDTIDAEAEYYERVWKKHQ
jgi:hypothetical protein